LVALVVTAAERGAAVAADRVDEDDARRTVSRKLIPKLVESEGVSPPEVL